MYLEDLVEETLEEFLLECVGDKVEEVLQLPAMLEGIEYLEDKDELIAETDECEILDVGDYSLCTAMKRTEKYILCTRSTTFCRPLSIRNSSGAYKAR